MPPDIIKFILVTLFSLLIGLEQRRHYIKEEFESLFGTDRTFTLIGILGFILYIISPQTFVPFLGGGLVVSVFLGIFYYEKIKTKKMFGITTPIIALITYCLAPLVYTQPHWLVLAIVVVVLVITELKITLFEFSKKFDKDEFSTLAKFLTLAGVILPLLPDVPISEYIPTTPYRFWLAIVAVSGVSYLSYLLRKFVFPESGILLTGILGGLYSSTASTLILSKKSKDVTDVGELIGSIILSTAMMFVRILLLAVFFNQTLAGLLLPYFSILIAMCAGFAFYFYKYYGVVKIAGIDTLQIGTDKNPLELKTALVFALLFIVFSLLTTYVHKYYGNDGISLLSLVVGISDVDPFILNLFQGHWQLDNALVIHAILIAVSSNNVFKMVLSLFYIDDDFRFPVLISFGSLVITGFVMAFLF